MRYSIIFAVLSACLISACGGGSDAARTLEKVTALEAKVAELDARLKVMTTDYWRSKWSVPQASVEFDPQDEKKYQSVTAPAGTMLVVLEKLEPYLDGYTVSMRMGNPTAAGFAGLKGSVKWGRLFDPQKDLEYNKLSEKEIDLKDVLLSGAWTVVRFNIAPAKPEEVRRIIFAPTFDVVQLRRSTN